MTKTRASAPSLPFLDDRGRPLNAAPHDVIAAELGPGTAKRLLLQSAPLTAMAVLTLVLISLGVWPMARPWSGYGPWTIGAILGYGVVGVIVASRIRRLRASSQSPLASLLAAHRRCGACGYRLHEIEPAADGCCVCPECGGAWHRDRFVLADRDADNDGTLTGLLAHGHRFPSPVREDDRGMPMARPWRWPAHWYQNDRFATGISAELRPIDRAVRAKLQRFGLPIALAAWLGAATLITRAKDDIERVDVIVILVVTFLITSVLYFAIVRRWLPERSMRAQVRARGICLSCGAQLPTNPPATFDSCVVCSSCKRAWRPRPAPDGSVTGV